MVSDRSIVGYRDREVFRRVILGLLCVEKEVEIECRDILLRV